QNRYIAKQFTEIIRKIESLYKRDAERQVEAVQRNVLADYGEFYRLKRENQSLSEIIQELESELNTWIGQLAVPSIRNLVFAVADALIGGQPVPISSGGGGNSNSDLRWDGRRPDEEDEAYRRRCMKYAITVVMRASKSRIRSQ
ncbi:MAG: recombinase, partial [Rikenellaceae bacterium]|nr:recombinase [Rikenellaceae bacterium]